MGWGMSEYKLREALSGLVFYFEENFNNLDCGELYDAVQFAKEALAHPTEAVELSANDMTTLFAIKESCLKDYDDVMSATITMRGIALALSALLTRHEAKRSHQNDLPNKFRA